jgi:hypothetical protein
MADVHAYGLIAEFKTPDALIEATKNAREAGYRRIDAFTPFPIEGLAEILELRDRRVLWLGFAGAWFGFLVALGMQIFSNYDYPLDVGGRPLYPLSAFMVIAFELTILFSAFFTAFGMLYLNGLPRLHHPLFSAPRFQLASRDRFFLCIKADDPRFSEGKTATFLRKTGAMAVELVPA